MITYIRPHILTTAIDEADPTASTDLALEVASHFGLKVSEARAIVEEVSGVVSGWKDTAANIGLSAKEIERMASAFRAE